MSAPPPPPRSKSSKKKSSKRKREEEEMPTTPIPTTTSTAPPPPKRKKKDAPTSSVFDKLNEAPPPKKKKKVSTTASEKIAPTTVIEANMVVADDMFRKAIRQELTTILQEVASAKTDDESPLVRAAFAAGRRVILGPNNDERANDARSFLHDPKKSFIELFNAAVQSARENDGGGATSV